jgi:hypothetical protein
MRPEDVPADWAREFLSALIEHEKPCEVNTGAIYAALAAVIPAIQAEALEWAAVTAEAFPLRTHGGLATDPYASAEQAADEIAAAIRAMKEPTP